MVSVKPILWKIYDKTNRLVGYMYKNGDKFVIVDLNGNTFEVSKDTTLSHAVRILLSRQSIIA